MRIPVGTQVTWTSQSQGTTKTKTGTVVLFIPAGALPQKNVSLAVPIPKNRVKFDLRPSMYDRYVVEVPRGGKSTLSDFYAPLAKWLEKGSPYTPPNTLEKE